MTSSIRKVKRAAAKAADSRERLDEAIRDAYAEGNSLRTISHAAGVSHEQVRVIVSR